jgi:imidazole glycerol-phosphate synthase subunit HisH
MKILIIDYGVGNLKSLQNQFKRLGFEAIISSDVNMIDDADKLILPGVGHFAYGMKRLQELGIVDVLNKKVIKEKTPILGICLGMQIFTEWSEEGNIKGLGWLKAKTIRFNFNDQIKKYKIPHMGWNTIDIKKDSKLFKNIENGSLFYFVHSYYVVCTEKVDVLATTDYGCIFDSAIQKGNIYGTQFHPEKSFDKGLQFLKNFVESA